MYVCGRLFGELVQALSTYFWQQAWCNRDIDRVEQGIRFRTFALELCL